ncbi:hypothetical protein SLEP1_g47507 [Rubroshorea leprosula]|uniref:ATP synthase F0 subunit 8 n=1 Tax=Rubroshorea leprosula TaxID=152421 RepID=A0AAV5LQP4_9ROSI|nr:hypothetical protein SLEP1_g47507 [Rubroshorea leprosula]
MLRQERFALVVAMCILAVGAVILQLALYLHIEIGWWRVSWFPLYYCIYPPPSPKNLSLPAIPDFSVRTLSLPIFLLLPKFNSPPSDPFFFNVRLGNPNAIRSSPSYEENRLSHSITESMN